MTRLATLDDMPRILQMGKDFYKVAGITTGFDDASFTCFCNMLMDGDENRTLIISDSGLIGGMIIPAFCNQKWAQAIEVMWWSTSGHGIELLRAFERWAIGRGANEIRLSEISGVSMAGKIYKRIGYAPKETSYSKVIKCH